MSFRLLASAFLAASPLLQAQTPPPQPSLVAEKPVLPTEIESERLYIENDGERATFLFEGGVALSATNLRLDCDRLEVFASREEDLDAPIGKFGAIQRILATGNVRIEQEERVATAGQAEVLPREEVIILTEEPTVMQAGTTVSGEKLTIERGRGRIQVQGSERRKVRLSGPPIRDLGFEEDPENPTPPVDEEATAAETDETDTVSPDNEKEEAPQADEEAEQVE